MRLVTNSVSPTKVEQTEFGWRIEDVPFVKSMNLSGGYVPEWSIKETANAWNGTPPTLNHPRNDKGQPIAANRKPELQLGRIENATFDGEFVRGDIQVNEADLVRLGGEALDIRDALESGDPINVSSQYVGEDLPPGEYDGEHRSNVEKIAKPDSVALLPNKKGRCDISDGCGINPQMVANSDLSIPMIDTDDGETPEGQSMRANKTVDGIEYSGTASGSLDESEIPNDDYEGHYVFDADTKSESSFPLVDAEGNLRAGNVASAFRFRGDAPDEERLVSILETVNGEFDDPPIDSENFDMSSNSALGRIKSFLGIESDFNEGAESSADAETTMDRDKLIDEITTNSALTEAALSERCDDGLEAIHDDIMDANDGPDGGGEEYVELTEEEFMARVDERAEAKAEEMVANMEEQSAKEEAAEEIVANSAEYEDTESVLEDYPTEAALETKRDSLDSGATMPGTGATANTEFESDDMDELSGGVF